MNETVEGNLLLCKKEIEKARSEMGEGVVNAVEVRVGVKSFGIKT